MEAERINLLNNTIADLEKRSGEIRVYLDYDGKKDRLEEVVGLSEDPELWNDPKRAQEIGKERKVLEGIVLTLDNIASGIDDKSQFDTGLLFISYQKDPKAFIDIQNAFGNVDKMNEYITHIGSGIFDCFPGVKDENDYLGKTLFTQN